MNEYQASDINLVDRLQKQIREMVLIGELRPGEPVRQVNLADKLEVSRTPLRTALAQLANDGVLTYEPNCGYTVRQFTAADVHASFELRATIEGLATRIVAHKGIDETLKGEFERLLAEGDSVIGEDKLHEEGLPVFRNMNIAFHKLIQKISGNPWIVEFVERLHNIPLSSDRVILWDSIDVVRRGHDDHHRIVEQILARNEFRAELLMVEHILAAGELLSKRLENDPVAPFRHLAGFDVMKSRYSAEIDFS